MNFTREQKLVDQAQFDAVFNKAKKVSHRYMLALYRANQVNFARLGVIVSKRVAKKAVSRNRIKRTVRESFRANKSRLTGIDVIVLLRQINGEINKTELREVIDQLWEKLIAGRQGI